MLMQTQAYFQTVGGGTISMISTPLLHQLQVSLMSDVHIKVGSSTRRQLQRGPAECVPVMTAQNEHTTHQLARTFCVKPNFTDVPKRPADVNKHNITDMARRTMRVIHYIGRRQDHQGRRAELSAQVSCKLRRRMPWALQMRPSHGEAARLLAMV